MSFPDSSAGRESTCNAGDVGSIPGLGRSPGEGVGYPLQNSWASLVAQMVKNPPAMREIWVCSLGWEGPLEDGMAAHSSILDWRMSMDRGAWWATVHGVAKSWTRLSDWAHAHIRQGVGKGTENFSFLPDQLSPQISMLSPACKLSEHSPLESLQRFSYIGMTLNH